MSNLIVTVDVEPDVDQDGNFYEVSSFKGALEGLERLKELVGLKKLTFFISPRFLGDNFVAKVWREFDHWMSSDIELGILFWPGDYEPNLETVSKGKHLQKSFDLDREALKEKFENCIVLYKDIKPTAIRFGGAYVNSDVLEWLGENNYGLTHSSSTAPGMLSVDKTVDHRLYKHDAYRIGNIIEVPFSIYGENRVGWVSPVMGFGLTDNVFEIMRKAPVININFSLRDLACGGSIFIKDEEDVDILMDRLEAWLWFAEKRKLVFKTVSEIEPISEGI